ncbi:MAG: hypothetical protein R2867_43525 [Caldilineaceae bacterium]
MTYVESCHLRHGQKVIRQPRQLLNAIPGLTFTELQQPGSPLWQRRRLQYHPAGDGQPGAMPNSPMSNRLVLT